MFIKTYLSESGNDFSATMECEHCGNTQKITTGYHDNFYHTKVIPAMTCAGCGKNRDGVIPVKQNQQGLLHVV